MGEKNNNRFFTPHVLIRLAGFPYHILDKLKHEKTSRLIDRLVKVESERDEVGSELINHLYNIIGSIKDETTRKKLIKIKRDIKQNRIPKEQSINYILGTNSRFVEQLFQKWVSKDNEVKCIKEKINGVFEEELIQSRQNMQNIVDNEDFKKGLLLSSRGLYEKLNKYLSTPIDKQNAKLRKIEKMLMVYLSRITTKTSPFSTFTPIGLANFNKQKGIMSAYWDEGKVRVKINHLIILYLIQAAEQHPDIIEEIPLTVNPELKIENGKVQLLQTMWRTGDEYMKSTINNEAFVKFNYTKQIEKILKTVKNNPGITLQLLKHKLSKESNSSPNDIENFIKQLISLQVLNARFQIPDNVDDIISAWLNKIDGFSGFTVSSLREILKEIKKEVDSYTVKKSDDRKSSLDKISSLYSKACSVLKIPIKNYSPIVYEDVSFSNKFVQLNRDEWESTKKHLELLQQILPLFSVNLSYTATFQEYFLRKYGPNGQCNDILSFLEEYRQFFQNSFQNKRFDEDYFNPFNLPLIEQVNELKNELYKYVISEINKSKKEEVCLDPEWINAFTKKIPTKIKPFVESYSYFVQPFLDQKNKIHLVINQIASGFGQFMSRFDSLYPHENGLTFSESVRRIYRELIPKEHQFAELGGVFGFNGNLHNAIAPYEIVYPGIQTNRSPEECIYLRDLTLFHSDFDDRLYFRSKKTGEIIHPLYLGTLTWFLLPPLYRLLFLMVPSSYFTLPLSRQYYQSLAQEQREKIVHIPRIRLGNLILSRQQWWIPKSEQPILKPNWEDATNLLELKKWRESHNIPKEVFIRLSPGIYYTETNTKREDWFKDALRKPQYIHFENVWLCNLFIKYNKLASQAYMLEEMFPNADQLFVISERGKYVSEFVLELNAQKKN